MSRADASALRAAWSEFLISDRTHAVTLAYNNRHAGSSSPCYRVTPDGECLQLRAASGADTNRLPVIRYVPLTQVHSDLHKLHRDVDRRLFGTRFNRPGSQRTSFTGFVEAADENIHVHMGWTVPVYRTEEFDVVIRNLWLATSRYVSIKIVPVRDSGWADYIRKCHEALVGEAALFVSDPVSRA